MMESDWLVITQLEEGIWMVPEEGLTENLVTGGKPTQGGGARSTESLIRKVLLFHRPALQLFQAWSPRLIQASKPDHIRADSYLCSWVP